MKMYVKYSKYLETSDFFKINGIIEAWTKICHLTMTCWIFSAGLLENEV